MKNTFLSLVVKATCWPSLDSTADSVMRVDYGKQICRTRANYSSVYTRPLAICFYCVLVFRKSYSFSYGGVLVASLWNHTCRPFVLVWMSSSRTVSVTFWRDLLVWMFHGQTRERAETACCIRVTDVFIQLIPANASPSLLVHRTSYMSGWCL